jgi:polar amino acid transport system substrate-binding protein
MKLNQLKVLLVTLFVLTLMFTSTSFAIGEKSTLDKILDEGVLRVGETLDCPPNGYYDDKGEPAGYEVDVAKKIAEMLGVKLEIIDTPAPSRISALLAGKVDITFSGLAITPARALAVSYARPYISNTAWIITKKDSVINNFEDIAGKKVGVVKGSTPEINLMEIVKNWENKPEIISYSSDADVLMVLSQGKVDALANTKIVFEKQFNAIFPDQYKIVGPAFFKEFCAPAVRKGDKELLEWLNTALWAMIVLTPDMNNLNKKYYGIPLEEEVYWGLN